MAFLKQRTHVWSKTTSIEIIRLCETGDFVEMDFELEALFAHRDENKDETVNLQTDHKIYKKAITRRRFGSPKGGTRMR